jgi:alpha-tubulin suppressor-like RCC1 family protein
VGGSFNYMGDEMRNKFAVFQGGNRPDHIKTISMAKGSGDHMLVIQSDGKVYGWGRNDLGQLGNHSTVNSPVPVAVDTSGVLAGKIVKKVAIDENFSMALTTDGKVYAWGDNSDGELGNHTKVNSLVPVAVDTTGVLSGKTIVDIAAGTNNGLALDSEGKVYSWGLNPSGWEKNNSFNTKITTVPIEVETSGVLSGKRIISIAAGDRFGVLLTADGLVYTWGEFYFDEDNKLIYHTPVLIDTSGVLSGQKIAAIDAGVFHTLALSTMGKVYAWGDNIQGQLGNGSDTDTYITPVAVNTTGVLSGKSMTAISAGFWTSLALASDANVYAWGVSTGTGYTGSHNVPVAVDRSGSLNGKSIVAISAGDEFSTVLSCDGKVYSWGDNTYGQLGNNTTTDSYFPTEVIWGVTSVEHKSGGSTKMKLLQNYPNPIRTTTTFRYTVVPNSDRHSAYQEVSLKIYDIFGRDIATLVNKKQAAGSYHVGFDASSMPSGIYFYKLQVGKKTMVRKMLVQK